ncbi:Pecanex-like protein 1 [Actinoplanes sp. TFC3]|uniref:Pecanex-like protein 1 n=1 Tax=Actinoplanes sp. TFC3 TaxID=1710355 RepID=UPI0009EA15E4|nr:Pecanex-like protein 1 [Actinoplanes sp. TFC3]
MRRSHYRRESRFPAWFTGRRRIIAAVATVVAFGSIVTVTQVSDASTKSRNQQRALAACNNIQAPKRSKLSTETKTGTYTTNKGRVTQHSDDGASDVPTTEQLRARCRQWMNQNGGGANNGGGNNGSAAPTPSGSTAAGGGQQGGGQQGGGQQGGGQQGGGNNGGGAATPPPGAGLGILTNSCSTSQLQPHTGFQDGDRCVSTEFGEVSSAANNPSLLITEAPAQVGVNEAFTIKVSTRNLIRDRFLAAGQGGYYVESSVLQNGIVRGHFHTACRVLGSTNEAPDPSPVPAFFVATEDKQGGAAPDTVTIQVPGLPNEGTFQCASWAGDGSHRIPMMQRANETPAFDAVRIEVGGGNGGGDNGGAGDNGGGQNNGGGNNGGGQNNGGGNNN